MLPLDISQQCIRGGETIDHWAKARRVSKVVDVRGRDKQQLQNSKSINISLVKLGVQNSLVKQNSSTTHFYTPLTFYI